MRFFRRLFILVALLLLCLVASVPANSQSATGVVISQVYGGGGNSGATFRNDFIELFNAGTTSVNLSGWTVQYASAAGAVFQATNLTAVTLAPGQYYLVQEAIGAGTSLPALPTPDAAGTIPMSGTSGVVALVQSNIPLVGCGISCATAPNVIDLVGYGATSNVEGAGAAPGLSNSTAALRKGNGCQDTNNNSADFVAGAPAPRNTASALNNCSSPTTPTLTLTPVISLTPSNTPTPSGVAVRIHDIQGASHISPLRNQNVSSVPGIVTAIYYITTSGVTSPRGFYMQDPSADADPKTSEGILVFTNTAPTNVVGDSVLVSGLVSEFRPGGSGGTANLTITEITAPTITLLTQGNALPAPVALSGPTTVIDDDSTGDAEVNGTFDPENDGLDYYETFEGMRVAVNNPIVVGPTSAFGEIAVLPDNGTGASVRTARGGILIRPNDFNPERVILDDEILLGLQIPMPAMNVTDSVNGAVVGIMDYSFGDFKLEVTNTFTPIAGGLTPEVTSLVGSSQLRVATFNVENLTPQDAASKYAALGSQVVNNLSSPDILVIEEVQDNNGATNNGVVDATATWNALINAIVTAGGPTYQYRQIDPVNNQDGGEGGGNIRQGFLFNPTRVTFVDRAGGTSTTPNAVTCVAGEAQLQYSPGRIDPANSAWSTSRKPLAGEFVYNGQRVIIIGNHFNSKGGDNPLFGHLQPPVLSSQVQRLAQATVVHDFVAQAVTCQPDANVVVLGDLNDFEFSSPIQTLKGTILDNMIETLPAIERYSYVFTGNSQVLDQILVSHHLTSAASPQYDVVHINAEFYNNAIPGSVRTSDHDPSLVALNLSAPTPTNTPTDTFTPTDNPTETLTPSSTPTATDTFTYTPVDTDTPTSTPTATDTFTDTPTETFTPSSTPTATDTFTYTPVDTDTPTFTATATDTFTDSPTETFTPSSTPTTTDTFTNTPVDTDTPTFTATATDTFTDTPTETFTPSSTPTATDTFTNTPVDTDTPTFTATSTFTFTATNTPPPLITATSLPSNTPSNTPAPAAAFYRAIDIGGPALVIDGHNWEANSGTTPNFTTNGKAYCNPYQALTPATDASRTTMIQCYREHWAFNAAMSNVPAGSYAVYLYVWQNWNDPANNVFSVKLEGQTVVSNYNPGHVAGVWTRLGPWNINVTDGTLNLTTSGTGVADLSGLEVYSLTGGSPATATNTPTNSPVPASPTRTNTPTNTPIAPSTTPTNTATNTPNGPSATPTNTSIPVSPTRTPTPSNTPFVPVGFYRAYNLGGPALTIDGHAWLAGNSSSLSVGGGTTLCNQAVTLTPATDANRAQMIRCSITGTAPNITIDNVVNGSYDVYVYVWEDNTPSTYSLSIQGGQVFVPTVNSGSAGSWQRMGPYTINVTGGWVSVDSFGGQANFSGIELYSR